MRLQKYNPVMWRIGFPSRKLRKIKYMNMMTEKMMGGREQGESLGFCIFPGENTKNVVSNTQKALRKTSDLIANLYM